MSRGPVAPHLLLVEDNPSYSDYISTELAGGLRSFRVTHAGSLAAALPLLAAGASLYLMYGLPFDTWARLIIWMALGVVIYFFYGARNSRLQREPSE